MNIDEITQLQLATADISQFKGSKNISGYIVMYGSFDLKFYA